MEKFIYAGVGSRKTPIPVLETMEKIAQQMAPKWHLRSGYADGADMAFGRGAHSANGDFTMYLPWDNFNKAPSHGEDQRFITPKPTAELVEIAVQAYDSQSAVQLGKKPAWNRVSDATKLMMARNVCQVMGEDLKTLADVVICWTKNAEAGGGTGQAIRIANICGVPVFDLADDFQCRALVEFINAFEEDNKDRLVSIPT